MKMPIRTHVPLVALAGGLLTATFGWVPRAQAEAKQPRTYEDDPYYAHHRDERRRSYEREERPRVYYGNEDWWTDYDRKGGQWGLTLGGSACMPGRADCDSDDVNVNGVDISGATNPSFGMGVELGYRFNPFVFLGGQYNFGLLDPDYDVVGGREYDIAWQHSVYAEVRPILPVWRFDFGLGLGPGWSRQVFLRDGDAKDYSQGFSFKIAPTIDFFVTKHIFIGAKADILLNAHQKMCQERGDVTLCVDDDDQMRVVPVHQVIFGFHLGGTFM